MPYITNIPNIAAELTDTTEFAVSQGATAGDQKKITGAVIKSYMTTAAGKTVANDIGAATGATTADKIKATIGDATTSAKGVVQLAATGVESATKVPKATGAEIAALLTAGGYTLTAPSGSNSLDGIADTATWKKVAAAVATALNADTYTANDADKVTDYGIGVAGLPSMASDVGNYKTSGMFRDPYGTFTGSPWSGSSAAQIIVLPFNSSDVVQVAYCGLGCRMRRYNGSSWSAWAEVWTSLSDGNGGQPPAPKPKAYSSNAIGEWRQVSITDTPSPNWTNPGGTWAYIGIKAKTDGTAFAAVYGDVTSGNIDGLGSVGYTLSFILWRIA